MNQVNVHGFTQVFSKIESEIITECGVSLPHNPVTDGDKYVIIKTPGLWDSGATNSVITKELASKLGLIPIRTVESHHAGGSSTVNVYLINIYLPNSVGIAFVQVSECVETIGRFGLLIGMDVISRGDFAISSFAGKTTFSFRMPSIQSIHLERDCLPPNTTLSSEEKTKSPTVPTNKPISKNSKCPCGSGKLYKRCHGK